MITSTLQSLPVASGAAIWAELRDASRGRRTALLAAVVAGILSAAAGLVTPMLIGRLVDQVASGSATVDAVVVLTAWMVGAAIASALVSAGAVVLAARTYQGILAELRERLIARAMRLPQGVVERAGTGDLISRASDDVSQVADAAPQILPALTRSTFTAVVTVIGMACIDWRYAAATVLLIPAYVVILRWYLRTGPPIYRVERAAMSVRAQQIVESQRGHASVRGLGLSAARHRVVLDSSWSVATPTLRARTVQNMFLTRLKVAEYVGTCAVLVTGFALIGAGESSIGAATAAVLLYQRLFGPITQLLMVVDVLQSAIASLGRMVGVITMPEVSADTRASITVVGGVHLEHVTFGYDQKEPAIADIELRIEPGQKVAVVGASGAGKTTLGSVIAGIHAPDSGRLTRPARTVVVSQHAHVFNGTLRENLTLVDGDAAEAEIAAALQKVGAQSVLHVLPDGLDTMLGAHGFALTPAQAQLVALARVVLQDPALAILDEATAEAGTAYAEVLDRAADAALEGRTGLVIAHRLSQAATCDRVIVMERGRIVESGTHSELVARGGEYARMWTAWSADRS